MKVCLVVYLVVSLVAANLESNRALQTGFVSRDQKGVEVDYNLQGVLLELHKKVVVEQQGVHHNWR